MNNYGLKTQLVHIKWSKTQLFKIVQLGGFLDRLLRPLMRVGLLFLKNLLAALAKGLLIQSEQWQQIQLFKNNYANSLKQRSETHHENS